MYSKDIIKKALTQNNVSEEDVVVIKTNKTTTFSIHLLRVLVLLLYNFFLVEEIREDEQTDFIMQNFSTMLDIVITELEIELHNFTILYDEELADIVELYYIDEYLLVLMIQEKVNKKVKKIIRNRRD